MFWVHHEGFNNDWIVSMIKLMVFEFQNQVAFPWTWRASRLSVELGSKASAIWTCLRPCIYRIVIVPTKLAIVFSSWGPTPCQGANGPVRIHAHDPQAPPLHGEAPILIGIKHLHGWGNTRIWDEGSWWHWIIQTNGSWYPQKAFQ